MKMRDLFVAIAYVMLSVAVSSCSSESDFRDAVSRFAKGDVKSLNEVEHIFIKCIVKEKYDEKGLALNDSALFRYTDSDIEVLYPEEMSFNYEGKINDIVFSVADEIATYTDGKNIYYISDGDSNIVFTSGDKEDIKSLLIVKEGIVYYLRSNLYIIDVNLKTSKLLLKDVVTSPYKSYYSVIMKKYGDSIIVASGIAGSYHISVVEYPSMNIRVKNVQAASSKNYSDEIELYYIGGTTGNWEVFRMNLLTKNKRSIERMKNITEFVFANNGYFYENAEGLHISGYREKSKTIPVRFQLIGSLAGDCIIKYNNEIYVADSADLLKYGFLMSQLLHNR
jgi:hypothetical protein